MKDVFLLLKRKSNAITHVILNSKENLQFHNNKKEDIFY